MIAANANVRSVKYTQTILDITNRVEHCELDSRSFDNRWPTFEILSLLVSAENLQQTAYHIPVTS